MEITTGGLNASIRAKGDTKSLILAWVLLTTHVAKKLKVPLPKMLAIYAALRGDVEDLRRGAEICEIDLSGLRKGDALPVPRGQYHGLYIEMKTESGHTSDEQEWWGERLQAQGYVWRVCHGWQAAVAVLEWYLQL